MDFSDYFGCILGGELSLYPKKLPAVVCNRCCIRALVPGVFVFPSRVIVPCSTAPFEVCSCFIHSLCLPCPRPLSTFLRHGADPPHPTGNERRRLLASVRKRTSAGASSSCAHGVWLPGVGRRNGAGFLHHRYVHAS